MVAELKKQGGQGFAQHETSENYSDVWLTPDPYVLPLGEFDLDPCAWRARLLPNCREHYFKRGLERDWKGRVFMNAPYSILEAFVKKFYQHKQGIALTFLRAETKLFFRYVWPHASGLLIPDKRIAFLKPDGAQADNSGGAASVYFAYSTEDARVLRDCGIPGAFIAKADIERKYAPIRLTPFGIGSRPHRKGTVMSGIYEHLVPENLDPVPVHVYEHPDWDMKLILLAEPNSRQQALDNLGDPCPRCDVRRDGLTHLDESQLTMTEVAMPRDEVVNLPEFDG